MAGVPGLPPGILPFALRASSAMATLFDFVDSPHPCGSPSGHAMRVPFCSRQNGPGKIVEPHGSHPGGRLEV